MNKRVHNALRKSANVWSDALLGLVPDAVITAATAPVAMATGPAALTSRAVADRMLDRAYEGGKIIADAAGSASGVEQAKKEQVKDLLKIQESPAKALIPLVGTYRLGKRRAVMQNLLRDAEDDSSRSRAIYTYLSGLNPLNYVAMPFAALAAAVTGKRTLAEHKAKTVDEPHYGWKSFLIPGYSTYHQLKTQGASDRINPYMTESDMEGLDDKTKQAIRDALAEHKKGKEKDKGKDKDKA